MKHLVVLAILTLVSRVCAADEHVPEFTVTGYGKVFYTVDMADMRFSVSVRDKNVQECKRKHDAVVDKLNEYLKAQKYPQEMLSLENTILKRERPSRDSYTYLAQSTYSMRTVESRSSARSKLTSLRSVLTKSTSSSSSRPSNGNSRIKHESMRSTMRRVNPF